MGFNVYSPWVGVTLAVVSLGAVELPMPIEAPVTVTLEEPVGVAPTSDTISVADHNLYIRTVMDSSPLTGSARAEADEELLAFVKKWVAPRTDINFSGGNVGAG